MSVFLLILAVPFLLIGGLSAAISVSKKTDFLVVGDLSEHGGQAAKKETADQLIADGEKLRELTEADFLRMIAEAKEALARG